MSKPPSIIYASLVKRKRPKAGNIAADGAIIIAQGDNKAFLVEVNCQTDFVAKTIASQRLQKSGQYSTRNNTTDVAAISELPYGDGQTVEEARVSLVQKSAKTSKYAVLKPSKVTILLHTVTVYVLVWLYL